MGFTNSVGRANVNLMKDGPDDDFSIYNLFILFYYPKVFML